MPLKYLQRYINKTTKQFFSQEIKNEKILIAKMNNTSKLE